jgi:hypothetical protein
LEGRGSFEFSKERTLLLQRFLKTKIRDFLSGGVKLAVVVSVDFLTKDLLGGFDGGDIFSDTSSNQMVLEPTIRSFDLSFRLRRKGISDFYIAVFQNLFPLRGDLIGLKIVLPPEGIPSLDKSEDGMGIYVVTVRESVPKDDGLESLNIESEAGKGTTLRASWSSHKPSTKIFNLDGI